MLSTLLVIFTLVLLIICILVVLVILMQRPSADAGMGASLGGGAAESAFGGETGNVLTKVCVRGIVVFFILTFLLFIGNIYSKNLHREASGPNVPSLGAVVSELEKSAATDKPANDSAPSKEIQQIETPNVN